MRGGACDDAMVARVGAMGTADEAGRDAKRGGPIGPTDGAEERLEKPVPNRRMEKFRWKARKERVMAADRRR